MPPRHPDLAPADRELVQHLVTAYLPPCRAFIFGSRACGTARRFSDLDLAVEAAGPLDLGHLERLRDALSLSALPMRVDVVDLSAVTPAFRRRIAPDLLLL